MIKACFQKHQQIIVGVSVSGHAGYDDAGLDIVCAGVSSAVRFTANLITELYRIPATVIAEDNCISILIPAAHRSPDSEKILGGLQLELKQIQEEFPDCIQIEHTEV